jgi:hypothetical protein
MTGLTLPETQDCVKAAALGLEYQPGHATGTFSIAAQLERDVELMAVSRTGAGGALLAAWRGATHSAALHTRSARQRLPPAASDTKP